MTGADKSGWPMARPIDWRPGPPQPIARWYSHIGVVATTEGLTNMIGGKGGGSLGVGTPGVGGNESPRGGMEEVEWWREWDSGVRVWARGTKPAARIFGPTIHRASSAPCECFAS